MSYDVVVAPTDGSDPAEAGIAFVAECDADSIVMGTHGRSGFDRIRHAESTTERGLRSAAVPVLAVPPVGAGRS